MATTNKKVSLDHAVLVLSIAVRDELRDYAFGDSEIGWTHGEQEVASGYVGNSGTCITVFATGRFEATVFEGKEAERLRYLGLRGQTWRNDSLNL